MLAKFTARLWAVALNPSAQELVLGVAERVYF